MRTISLLLFAGIMIACCACQQASYNKKTNRRPAPMTSADSARLFKHANACLEKALQDTTGLKPLLLDSAWTGFRTLGDKNKGMETAGEYFSLYRNTDRERLNEVLNRLISEAWWGEDSLKGWLYMLQGWTLRKLERYYSAAIYYEKARELSDRYGGVHDDPAGVIYKSLANIKTRLGENEEAVKLLLEALRLLEKDTVAENRLSNMVDRANVYNDLGAAYQNMENYAEALKQFQTGLSVLQGIKEQTSDVAKAKGLLLTSVAVVLAYYGQLGPAEQKIREALAVLPPENVRYRFSAYTCLADIQKQSADDSGAMRTLETALAFADSNANKESSVETREVVKLVNTIGWTACARNDYHTALRRSQEALHRLFPNIAADAYTQNPDPSWIDPENAVAEALDLKGEALWQLYQSNSTPAHLDLAGETTGLAVQMMENLRDAAVYESSKLHSTQQNRRLFNRMMRILYARQAGGDRQAAERAFAYSERSKAVLLGQKLAADAALAKATLPDSLRQREIDLKEQWATLKNELFERQMEGKALDDSTAKVNSQRLFYLENELRALREHLSAAYHIELDKQETPAATVADVQKKLLRPGETWVTYFTDRDSSLLYIIAVDQKGVRWKRQAYRENTVRHFIENFNTLALAENRSGDPGLFAAFVRQSRQLFQTLLEPVFTGGAIPKRLALAPDGELALLPFDVLLHQSVAADTAEADYAALPLLVKASQTRLVPSASLELFNAANGKIRHRGPYVGFAPDYSGSALGQVVSGAKVVQDAAAAFEGEAYVGPHACLDTFLNKAAGYAIIHFHGHAEASDSEPDYSWMAFTAKGRPIAKVFLPKALSASMTLGGAASRLSPAEREHCLFAHQIYQAHLGADLVILSACETGMGKVALGEGTLSLSRAFQAAGCPATVMSLWEVRDDATADLIRVFLENIRQGQDKDEALANAKRSYLNTAGNAFPYFWAGFVLTGKSDPVRLSGSWWEKPGVWVLFIGAVLAVGAGVIRRLRKTKR
ncbi:MAG: CHAT domain-containing protein [Saprospirales bacterium]|nr:CHAT domain-containing protein [Saprospirales bacterium]